MQKFLLWLSVFALVACNAMFPNESQDDSLQIECRHDEFDGYTTCDSKLVETREDGYLSNKFCFRTVFKANKPDKDPVLRVLVSSYEDSIRSYDVMDKDQNHFSSYPVDVNVSCYSRCIFSEDILIHIERDYITKHRDSGITLKIYGKNGDSIVKIKPAHVQAFDDLLNKQRNAK